jgi:accessory colonization factor AcfC
MGWQVERFVDGDRVPITEETRFSTFVDENNGDGFVTLCTWLDWFRSRGKRAALVLTTSGYAVFREGLLPVGFDARKGIIKEVR